MARVESEPEEEADGRGEGGEGPDGVGAGGPEVSDSSGSSALERSTTTPRARNVVEGSAQSVQTHDFRLHVAAIEIGDRPIGHSRLVSDYHSHRIRAGR